MIHCCWSIHPRAASHSANKNNDNFDKAIKVKKINNIKRNVRVSILIQREKQMMTMRWFPRLRHWLGGSDWDLRFFMVRTQNSLSDWIILCWGEEDGIYASAYSWKQMLPLRSFIYPLIRMSSMGNESGDKRRTVSGSTQLKSSLLFLLQFLRTKFLIQRRTKKNWEAFYALLGILLSGHSSRRPSIHGDTKKWGILNQSQVHLCKITHSWVHCPPVQSPALDSFV